MQLLETIKYKNGKLYNMEFHQKRFALARNKWFPGSEHMLLAELIQIPEEFESGLFRCRVIYSEKIDKIEFIPHQYREVESLKLIEDNSIDYEYKYSNRKKLEILFKQRGNCDDILIVKNNCITDSFTANPIFFDGEKWWTPNSPLLKGTQRERLISEGKISVCPILTDDLLKFKKIGLINAMWDFNTMPILPISSIKK